MRTQSPLVHVLLVALLAVTHAATGCVPVDNSGGPPPSGDELDIEVLALPGTCGNFQSDAFLVRDQATLDAFLASCNIAEASRAEWQTAVDGLAADDEVLIYANVQLGGCLGAFAIEGAFLEGTTVNAWVLRQDFAHGKPNSACTDDIGEGAASMKVKGAAAATDAALTIGDFNPELPGAPQIVLP